MLARAIRVTKPISIALFPDRMAHYRRAIFRALADMDRSSIEFTFFGEKKRSRFGVKLIDPAKFRFDEGQRIPWVETQDFYLGKYCIWQSKLISVALRGEYSVLLLWGESHRLSTWIAACIAKITGKKVIFWTHGLYGGENFFKKWFRVLFYRLANALLLYGTYSKKLLLNHFSERKLYVINNSLDVKLQDTIYKTLSSNRKLELKNQYKLVGEKLICFVGRLTHFKRLDLLLDALHRLNMLGKNCSLIIVGSGDAESGLRDKTMSLQLENFVYFFGECYEDEKLIPLLAISDVLVSPGNIGLTAMHSLIAGTPVVTHSDATRQMPEYEAVVEGVSGYLYEIENVNDLVDKIILCFDSLDEGVISPETCRTIIFQRYSPEFQVDVFKNVLTFLYR